MDISDQIAENFQNQAYQLAPNPLTKQIVPIELKDYHLVWDSETVEEIATGVKISEHNWTKKLEKIDGFYKDFLNGRIKETQILVVKDINRPELLIIDGIHRSVGFYKAYLENHLVVSKTNFTYKFFVSDKIHKMYDYNRLFGKRILSYNDPNVIDRFAHLRSKRKFKK